MLVVDTNLIVALYIQGPHTRDVRALQARDTDWRTEPFALIEVSNVLATYHRRGYLSAIDADAYLMHVETFLTPGFQPVSARLALDMAMRHGITAYDARFVAVAETLDARLITEDAKLRAAVPERTLSLADALAG